MGKAIFIVLAAFIVAGTFYTLSSRESMLRSSERVSNHQYGTLARGAAINGLNFARQALAESFRSYKFSGSYSGARYTVDVDVSGNRATVVSSGAISNASNTDQTYTVNAEFVSLLGDLPPTPAFMQYGLISDQSLYLGGLIEIEVYLDGEEGQEINANLHTNRSLHLNGNRISVEGYGTYRDNASANPRRALETSFQPNHVTKEGDTVYRADAEVEIPSFDAAAWVNQLEANGVEVTEIPGDFVLSGTYDFGDREVPQVYHVLGDLKSTGGTVINGYGMFIVEGNIELSSNLEVGLSGYDGIDESSLALYASGDISVTGTVEVAAQFYAGGDFKLDGNPTIYGSIATKGTTDIQGNPKMFYRLASAGLTQNWQARDRTFRLVGYYER